MVRVGLDLGRLGAGSVDGERSATDLLEPEGQERRPVRDAQLGEHVVVAAVLVEKPSTTALRVSCTVRARSPASSPRSIMKSSDGDSVTRFTSEVIGGIVIAVRVHVRGQCGDVVSPPVEHSARGGSDEVLEQRLHRRVVAVVDDIGEHPGVVEPDPPGGQRGVDGGEHRGELLRDHEPLAGDAAREPGAVGEPLGGGEPGQQVGDPAVVELGQEVRFGSIGEPAEVLELQGDVAAGRTGRGRPRRCGRDGSARDRRVAPRSGLGRPCRSVRGLPVHRTSVRQARDGV